MAKNERGAMANVGKPEKLGMLHIGMVDFPRVLVELKNLQFSV